MERIPVTSPASIAVFQRILTHGPVARIDVARATGLSQAAVTKAVGPLIEGGYVTEVAGERSESGPGRPSQPLQVCADRVHVVGVKVTATRVFAVLTDLRASILASASRPVGSVAVEVVVEAICAAVKDVREAAPGLIPAGVGVAVSGDVDHRGGVVRDAPLMSWQAVPLRDELEALLGVEVIVENDAHALTMAEHMLGLGRDADSFAVVTIGAGIGCGVYVNGDVVRGAYGVSGEIGHLPLAPFDLVCSCGRRGCVETIASSEAILSRVRAEVGDPELSLAEALKLAHEGVPAAREAFAGAGEVIGSALSTLINLVGPQMVILAGEGVTDYDLYETGLRRSLQQHTFGAASSCEVVVRPHTFDDWARGAAVGVIRAVARRDG